MEDNHAYRYHAFITYSTKDKKIAQRILRQFESYKVPKMVRDRLEAATGKKYPKRMVPVFLDAVDLPVGLLGRSIYKELEDSRFLIVICSPSSAKSEWVNREVENFIFMGRYDRIIPCIVEGVPNSGDPETECFPPILRKNREFFTYSNLSPEENAAYQAKLHERLDGISDELKGVSLPGEGFKVSFLKMLARMLEITPEMTLGDRWFPKKKLFGVSRILTLLMLLFICLGFWTWDRCYRVHVGYFADYVESWGVPQGIFPLTSEQRAHREAHYRIYTKNRKVIRLEHVNSAGTPIPVDNSEFRDRPMIAVYPLYLNGRLVRRDALDRNGKVTMSFLYTGDNMQKVEFQSWGNDGSAFSLTLTNVTSLTNSLLDPTQEGKRGNIGNMSISWDSEGHVVEERFQKGVYNIPTTDEQGIAGFRYERDEFGRVIEKVYLGPDGNPHPDKSGVARRTNRYDERGNLVEAEYFNQNGDLTPNELGWMHVLRMFDKYGNLVEEKYVDASGNLSLSGDLTAGFTCKYDEHGNLVEAACFGADGKPCLCDDGCAKLVFKYDERGNQIENSFFGIDGKPCLRNDGCAKVQVKYDERGNMIEVASFGIDGKPCQDRDGSARILVKYDEDGNKIEVACFGIDGKPCLDKDGCAKVLLKYDSCRNKTEVACFGIDGQPCLCNGGYAKLVQKYDDFGNKIEVTSFGIDGQPCLRDVGYAKLVQKYDEHGNEIEMAFFGIDGQPCLHKDGYAKIMSKYDKRGNLIEMSFFDIVGKPCLNRNGFAKVIMKYDEHGDPVEAAYFDVDGKPIDPQ